MGRALCAAAKVFPVLLVPWLIVANNVRCVRWFLLASVVIAVLSVIGAGGAAHLEWLSIAGASASTDPLPQSLPALIATAGAPSILVTGSILVVMAGAVGLMYVFRSRPGIGFAIGIIAMVLANPVTHAGSYALLLPALMPLIERASRGRSDG